jgi:NodT family efflux transporter outer membrane factor (OMF) lipoprotein
MRRIAPLLTLAPLLSMLAGCTVGPNYRVPAVPAPVKFGETAPGQPVAPTGSLEGWWRAYNDPELNRLVDIALARGLDVKTAAARIVEARAQERVARSGLLPEVNADAQVQSQRFSKNAGLSSLASAFGGGSQGGSAGGGQSASGIALPGGFVTTYSLGFDASWELDLFGGTRRQIQSAVARTEAAVWNARDAQVSLVAEVVDDYFQIRQAQARELVARAEVQRQTRNLQIMGEHAKVGLVPEGDTIRQRAQLAQAQAAIGPLVAEGKSEMHALAVLLGRTPDSMILELSQPGVALPTPPIVPPGLPSELLRRRPDVRAAERNLAAATADIGVAVADLYPKFSLTGLVDLISTKLSNLFSSDSLQVNGTARGTFPVLDFGRRKGVVAQRKAQADEAYYQYQQTVLGALKDVEDALIRIRTEQQRQAHLQGGLADATRGLSAVDARYKTGLVDLSAVLDAQQSVLQDRDQLVQSEAQLRRDLVSLYRALGGGWEDMPPVDADASAAPAYEAPKRSE